MSTRSLSQDQGNRGTISQVREQKLKESRGSGGRGDDVWTGDPRTNSTRESPIAETRYKLGYKSGNGLWIEKVCPGALGRRPGAKTVSLSEKIGLVRFFSQVQRLDNSACSAYCGAGQKASPVLANQTEAVSPPHP